MKTMSPLLLVGLAHCFTAIGYGQTVPTPLASVKEGVYFFQNMYSTTVLELKDGSFRYWFSSDVQRSREPAYPLSGRYTTNGATLTLPHQEIHQTNWTSMTYDGKPTLWRPSALKYWDESKKMDPYGVLLPTTRKPEEIGGGKNGKASGTEQLPGVSIKSIGFTDTGQVQVLFGFLTPATNQTILSPRRSALFGPTNVTTSLPGGLAVVFQYSNSAPYSTVCTVQSMEHKTEGGWKAVPVPVSGGILVVGSNSMVLQTLPVNATNVEWRIRVFCVEQAAGVRRAVERGAELGREVITGQKTERFSGRKYFTVSSPATK